MGTIKQGINGPFKGKVGTVIGYIHKGRGVMRTVGERTTPPTEKELKNREKFAASQQWLKPLNDFLRIGFKDYAPTYEGFVAAKSYNQKHALKVNQEGEFYIDPALALVSFGDMDLPTTASAELNDTQTEILIKWDEKVKHIYNDYAMFVAYDIKNEEVYYSPALAKTSEGSAIFPNPNTRPWEATLHLYLAFVSNDRNRRSNSIYLGSVLAPSRKEKKTI